MMMVRCKQPYEHEHEHAHTRQGTEGTYSQRENEMRALKACPFTWLFFANFGPRCLYDYGNIAQMIERHIGKWPHNVHARAPHFKSSRSAFD